MQMSSRGENEMPEAGNQLTPNEVLQQDLSLEVEDRAFLAEARESSLKPTEFRDARNCCLLGGGG